MHGKVIKEGQQVEPGEILAKDSDNYSVPLLAPRAGTVRQILVDNAEPVEFGHPLMIID